MRNFLMMCALIMAGGTFLACIASGRWLLNGEINIFNALASFNTVTVQTGGVWGLGKQTIDFFSGIVTMLSWNYPFLSSAWCFPIKVILWVVSIGAIWGIVEVAATAVNGLVSAFRSFITPA